MKPFAVSQTISVAEGMTNATVANAAPLRNPYDRGAYIDEIALAPIGREYQFEILARFNWRGHELVADGLPFYMLGNPPVLKQYAGLVGFGDDLTLQMWKLPKPLYIPPGETLVPTLRHANWTINSGSGGTSPLNIRVMYRGRSLEAKDPVPRVANVPWVSGFTGAERAGGGTTDAYKFTEESQAPDFMNPHVQPVRVTHFSGSLVRYTGSRWLLESGAPYTTDVTVRIYSPAGEIMVRDEALFQQVFYRRNWPVETILPSKEHFTVLIDEDLRNDSVTLYTNQKIRVAVAMVGYREVPL